MPGQHTERFTGTGVTGNCSRQLCAGRVYTELEWRINEVKIAVAGTGYVGLVAGVCFAEKGHDVTCVDVDENKVRLMESGISPIYEEGLQELMQKNNATGRLHYTTDYQNAYRDVDAIFIGVGTPEQPDGSANLS